MYEYIHNSVLIVNNNNVWTIVNNSVLIVNNNNVWI